MSVVYVSNADSGSISVLQLDEHRGTLTTLQTVVGGGSLMPLALAPGRRFLYVARRSEPFAVLAFAIDPRSGALTPLGETPLPVSMANIAVDASGRWLFSASYGGNLVAVGALGADGLPHAVHQVIPTEPKAHAMRGDPSGRFVFATSLGGGLVMQFRFDAQAGRLAPNDPAAVRAGTGAGPRHLAFHPHAPFVYLLNELDASLDVFALDHDAGTLTPLQTVLSLPPGFAGEPWAADLHLTPDGRFLYSSERRSSTLATFAVDPASGRLTALGHTPVQTQPRGFRITPSGRFLIVAGQLSHRVGLHRIDATSGALELVQELEVGKNPNWIEALELSPA